MLTSHFLILTEESVGCFVIFYRVVYNRSGFVPQSKLIDTGLKRQATAGCTIWLSSVGKVSIFINAHKVKRRAVELVRVSLASVKYSPPFGMDTARFVIFGFDREVIFIVAGTIILIIQSWAIIALTNNLIVVNYYCSAFSSMARSFLSNFCRHFKKLVCIRQLIVRYQLHDSSIRPTFNSYKISRTQRLEPNLQMKILKQLFRGTCQKIHQDKNPTNSRVFIMVHLCDLLWNQIAPSLRLMQSKLIDLGFEYYNGNTVINETEIEGSRYHESF